MEEQGVEIGSFIWNNKSRIRGFKKQEEEDMYEYLLENIEEKYFDTDRAYNLDKAWEGIQLCINGGKWSETSNVPENIVFGGEILLDKDDYVITLKKSNEIKGIVNYLEEHKIEDIIRSNFSKIDENEYSMEKDEDNLEFLWEWSQEILEFYKNALKENLNVVFSVDL